MEEITRSEHRAIVFKMNRKEAAAVARYIKDHSGSPETIFAVDVDTLEMIIQAKNAHEDDVLVLEGEEDVFEVEEETIEENEEVWEAIEDALEGFADGVEEKVEAKAEELAAKVADALDGDK